MNKSGNHTRAHTTATVSLVTVRSFQIVMIQLPQGIHTHLLTQHMMRLVLCRVRQDTREQ